MEFGSHSQGVVGMRLWAGALAGQSWAEMHAAQLCELCGENSSRTAVRLFVGGCSLGGATKPVECVGACREQVGP